MSHFFKSYRMPIIYAFLSLVIASCGFCVGKIHSINHPYEWHYIHDTIEVYTEIPVPVIINLCDTTTSISPVVPEELPYVE